MFGECCDEFGEVSVSGIAHEGCDFERIFFARNDDFAERFGEGAIVAQGSGSQIGDRDALIDDGGGVRTIGGSGHEGRFFKGECDGASNGFIVEFGEFFIHFVAQREGLDEFVDVVSGDFHECAFGRLREFFAESVELLSDLGEDGFDVGFVDGVPGFDDGIGEGTRNESDGEEARKDDIVCFRRVERRKKGLVAPGVEEGFEFSETESGAADAIQIEIGRSQERQTGIFFFVDFKVGTNFAFFMPDKEGEIVNEDMSEEFLIDSIGICQRALLPGVIAQIRVDTGHLRRHHEGLDDGFKPFVAQFREFQWWEEIVPIVR